MKTKRLLRIIAILICLGVTFGLYGCKAGEEEENTNSNRIELTTENVNTYLNCTVQSYSSDYDWKTSMPSYVKSVLTVRGVSSNYDYNNVRITIELEGYIIIRGGSRKRFTQELSCRLDIGGNGSDSGTCFADNVTGKHGTRIDGVTGTNYTIKYVSGYVEKVK